MAFLLRIALVIPAGFEPTTHSLEGCCSIQLSYGTIVLSISYWPTWMRKSNTFFSIYLHLVNYFSHKVKYSAAGAMVALPDSGAIHLFWVEVVKKLNAIVDTPI